MLRAIYYVLWIAPALMFTAITVVMVRRNLRKDFPFFFSYALFQVITFVVQMVVYHKFPSQYFYAYWSMATISVLLGLAVIYELFAEVFRPFEGLRDLGAVLFRWAAAVLVVAAALMTMASSGANGSWVLNSIVSLERSVRVMQCGLVLLMILCAPYLGLLWRHRVFGIAAGFGILAAIDLFAVAILGHLGRFEAGTFYTLSRMGAYNFAVLLWTAYLLRPEPARQPALQLAPSERWDFALSSAMHPQSASPSLPLIMGVVDRAFERAGHEGHSNDPRKADH